MQFLKIGYVIGCAIFALWTVVVPGGLALAVVLNAIVRSGVVDWPPPNTTFSTFFFGSRRRSSRPSMKNAQVRHAYSRAAV